MVAKNNSRNIDIQIGILVAVVAAILIPLNIYRNKVGKNVSLAVTVILVIVAGVIIYEMVTRNDDIQELAEDVGDDLNKQFENFDVHDHSEEEHQEEHQEEHHQEDHHQEEFQSGMSQEEHHQEDDFQEDFQSGMSQDPSNLPMIPDDVPLINSQSPSVPDSVSSMPQNNLPLSSSELLPSPDSASNSNCAWNVATTSEPPVIQEIEGRIGMIGQTLRNANRDLRAAPPIAKQDICPWMNSTIEPDVSRRPLDHCDTSAPIQELDGHSGDDNYATL